MFGRFMSSLVPLLLMLSLACGTSGTSPATTGPAEAARWRDLPPVEDPAAAQASILRSDPSEIRREVEEGTPQEVLQIVATLDAAARELATTAPDEQGMGPVVLAAYFAAVGAPAAEAIGPMLSDDHPGVRNLAMHVLLSDALAARMPSEPGRGVVPAEQSLLDGMAVHLPTLTADLRRAAESPDATEQTGALLIAFVALGSRAAEASDLLAVLAGRAENMRVQDLATIAHAAAAPGEADRERLVGALARQGDAVNLLILTGSDLLDNALIAGLKSDEAAVRRSALDVILRGVDGLMFEHDYNEDLETRARRLLAAVEPLREDPDPLVRSQADRAVEALEHEIDPLDFLD